MAVHLRTMARFPYLVHPLHAQIPYSDFIHAGSRTNTDGKASVVD